MEYYEASIQEIDPQPPIIGILTIEDAQRKFRGNHKNFIDLIRTGKEQDASVFVITTKDLNLAGRRTVGYTYDFAKKAWLRQRIPLPQVLYNRIPYRKYELLPDVQQTIQSCIKHAQIRLFNPSFFNKWSLYEWLGNAKETSKYIPATQKLTSQNKFDTFLKQYPMLYLKPVRGKAGKGIMKVQEYQGKTKQQREYLLTIQGKKKSQTSRYSNSAELWEKLKESIDVDEYIFQQGIKLIHFKERPFDLRALVQKNRRGVWKMTGIGARIAGKLSITTHVPRGGSIDDPQKLLLSSFGPGPAKKMMAKVQKSALTIAKQIEKGSRQMLGEMSIDLGIDTSGRIWFFEANAKPMKFDEPDIRKKSLKRIIQYSSYLAKPMQNKSDESR